MSSFGSARLIVRTISIVMTIAVLTAFCVCSSNVAFAATCSGSLLPGGSATTDLLVNSPCTVVGLSGSIGVYVFHNVNIVAGGSLTFEDTRIDFHAENIIVENGGTLSAGTVMHPIGMNPPITVGGGSPMIVDAVNNPAPARDLFGRMYSGSPSITLAFTGYLCRLGNNQCR